MKIQITVSPEEYREVKTILQSSIVNYNKWERGEENLHYQLGHFISDDVFIIKK